MGWEVGGFVMGLLLGFVVGLLLGFFVCCGFVVGLEVGGFVVGREVGGFVVGWKVGSRDGCPEGDSETEGCPEGALEGLTGQALSLLIFTLSGRSSSPATPTLVTRMPKSPAILSNLMTKSFASALQTLNLTDLISSLLIPCVPICGGKEGRLGREW